ncbi:MAG: hypothetical protein ACYS32_19115 [Planctomycetota bacterium]|jgi:hypothetical protein
MKPIAHIEVIRKELDTLANEHPVKRGAWLAYSTLLSAIDDFEHEVNRMELVKERKDTQ